MAAPALTPTSYVVLGLVAVCGEATPYDLKALAAGTVGNFWSSRCSLSRPSPASRAGSL